MRRRSAGGRRLLVWLGAKGASVLAIASTLATSSCSRGSLLSTYNRMRGDPYALDDYDRTVDDSGDVVCPELELQTFRGSSVKFSPAVEVTEPFATRLQRFERVLVEVSRRHYRRAPIRVVNAGGYYCRAVRHRPGRLSEHALGNAIDIVGFDFGPVTQKGPDSTQGLAAHLTKSFSVRIQSDWRTTEPRDLVHAKFLSELTSELAERDVFRTMLGPGHPTHASHFHFDMAPYSYVQL